jgi:hypothetical protein
LDAKDAWGRSVYRTDIPVHNAVVHIEAWDVDGYELARYTIFAEAPLWIPKAVHVGTLPGEKEVHRESFDFRRDAPKADRTVGDLYVEWNIWDIRECGCGCFERKRAGVRKMQRAAKFATITDPDSGPAAGIPSEPVTLSSAALDVAQVEARARGVSLLCVIEVALRYLAVEYVHPGRYDTIPFTAADDAATRAAEVMGMQPTFSPDAMKIVEYAVRSGFRGVTSENVLDRAVELFASLPQNRRDNEWRFHTGS